MAGGCLQLVPREKIADSLESKLSGRMAGLTATKKR